MSDIPDGATITVAKAAIAWEIAKEAIKLSPNSRGGAVETDVAKVDVYTELFNRALEGLKKQSVER